ncbi:MAG: spore maturation protein [Clostridia bacterium]|nr:spore maturation protein [Clostridia bacterium]
MKYFALIIPVMLIALMVYAAIKKNAAYDSFAEGAAKAIPLVVSVFPYVATITIMTELFQQSGVSAFMTKAIAPIAEFLGIPSELTPLVLIKPFSGSGSLAILSDVYKTYGVDSYISRCASVIFGSSETIFYISAVYFSKVKKKRLIKPIIISLASTFISIIFACFICKF